MLDCFLFLEVGGAKRNLTLTNNGGVPSLPTVVEHHQVQVGRTSKRDCGRRWAAWTEGGLGSPAARLGWRRQPLLDFLHKAKVKEAVGIKCIGNLFNSGILSRQQCGKERSPGHLSNWTQAAPQ